MGIPWRPSPDTESNLLSVLRQWCAMAVLGVALHWMYWHGLDQLGVILALGALGIHPDIPPFKGKAWPEGERPKDE